MERIAARFAGTGSSDPRWIAFSNAMKQFAPGHAAEVYAAWGWLSGELPSPACAA
jgi:hypothetical protein